MAAISPASPASSAASSAASPVVPDALARRAAPVPAGRRLARLLWLDAATCAGMAVLLLVLAQVLAPVLGLPVALLQGCGLALGPCALLMVLAARALPQHHALAWVAVAGNVGWVLGSLGVAFWWTQPNTLGLALVLGQAVVVDVLAVLEWRALRQMAW